MIIGSRPVLKTGGRDERLGGSSPSASAKLISLGHIKRSIEEPK